jgi:hypothetical protein
MSVTTLTPDLTRRLTKILGMLGSDHDGEIAAAGRQAHRLIQQAGLTWPEVIAPTPPASQQHYRPPRRWRSPISYSDACAQCLLWPEALTDWETGFLQSIASRHRISDKQIAVLNRITAKCEAFARSAGENSHE